MIAPRLHDSYGVRRYFARYSADEIRTLLPSTGFDADDIQASRGNEVDWLVRACIAERALKLMDKGVDHVC